MLNKAAVHEIEFEKEQNKCKHYQVKIKDLGTKL